MWKDTLTIVTLVIGADLEVIIAGSIESCGSHGAKEVALDFYV